MTRKDNPFLAEIIPIVNDTWGGSCTLLSDKYDQKCFGNAGANFQVGQVIFTIERDRGDIFLSIGSVTGKMAHPISTIAKFLGFPLVFSNGVHGQLEFLKQHLSQIEELFHKEGINQILWDLSISISDELIREIAGKQKDTAT